MELFIFEFDRVDNICAMRESPFEVCEWAGVIGSDIGLR